MTEPLRMPNRGEFVRSLGRLIEIQNVTPPVEEVIDYIFETVDARVEARCNGRTLTTFATFNEFYGEGSGIKAAIHEARIQQQHHAPSSLEFVVIKITRRRRRRPNRQHPECFYAPGVQDFETLSNNWGQPEPTEELIFSITDATAEGPRTNDQ